MNPDPNAGPPHSPGPGQPQNPYDATRYGTPPPSAPGGGGPNYPYNPYGQENPYSVRNPYGEQQPPSEPVAPYNQYTQYTPPPAQQPGQNQYQGQFNYPNLAQSPLSPRPQRSVGRIILLVIMTVVVSGVVLTLLLAGIGAAVAHNEQVSDDATAVAQSHTNATVTAVSQVATTATAASVATAAAAANTYPFSADLQLNDALTGDNSQGAWDTSTECAFTNGSYDVSEAKSNVYNVCFATKSNFSNFTYEVTAKLVKGDLLGIVFRADEKTGKSYKFLVASDSTVALFLYKDYGTGKELYSANDVGWLMNQENKIAVVARGNSLSFYVNDKRIGAVSDSTYNSGQIGVTVFNTGKPAEATFSDAKVWAL